MDVTVQRIVDWKDDVLLLDAPSGFNSVELKPLQLEVLLDPHFPMGHSVTLPQPDATYSACTVIRFPHSWHFRQDGGRELMIPAEQWSVVKAAILAIYTPQR